MKIGIIAAPERATEITSQLVEYLPKRFGAIIDNHIKWEVEWQVDPLTGAAEAAHEILYNATFIKQQQGWDYAICLTDLPIFHRKGIVAADIGFNYQVAQISIPPYGWPPMKKRIRRTIIHLLGEMHDQAKSDQTETASTLITTGEEKSRPLQRRFPLIPIRREDEPEIEEAEHFNKEADKIISSRNIDGLLTASDSSNQQGQKDNQEDNVDHEPSYNNINVRFLMYSRILGQLRVMIGLTFANNPFKIMSSFKSVIAIAFTTGAFALIFPTIWKLSQLFSVIRLSGLMIAAVLGLAFWIIIVHHLWEPPSSKNKPPIRRLYNFATALTLIIDVTAYYVMLYLLFFIAVIIFIPPDYLGSILPDNNDPTLIRYMRVAWTEASIATIVSAMGAGLENDATVRNLTYGYRQKLRYEEMKKHSNS